MLELKSIVNYTEWGFDNLVGKQKVVYVVFIGSSFSFILKNNNAGVIYQNNYIHKFNRNI